MKIGIIGYGNMGSLIANNILKLDLLFDEESLIIANRHIEKIEYLKEKYTKEYESSKLELTDNNIKIAKECDKIIISVETPQFRDIIKEISEYINEDTHIIYTCAGLNFNHIKTFYNGKLTLIIPTIASMATDECSIKSNSRRKGISLFKHNSKVNIEDKQYIEDLFNEFSYVKLVEEGKEQNTNKIENNKFREDNELEIQTIITSCGPAFIGIILKKLANIISEKSNLTITEVEEMISKTIIGTLEVKNNYNFTTDEIMNKVATKGGITQEGIDYLDNSLDTITNELINQLLNRYSEVKKDMDKEYLQD